MTSPLDVTLLLIGPPASGKSTIRTALAEVVGRLRSDVISLGIDEVIEEMCAEGLLPGSTIAATGGVHLSDPVRETAMALDRLMEVRRDHQGTAIVEIPLVNDWLAAYHDNHGELCDSSLVIYLRATLESRLRRNSRRRSPIAEENLRCMDGELAAEAANTMLRSTRGLVAIDTDRLGPAATRRVAEGWLTSHL